MKIGDLGFFYHSGEDREIVGIMEVSALAHPDPKDDTGKWQCVDVRAVAALPKPVTLAAVKANPMLAKHGASEEFAAFRAAGLGRGVDRGLPHGRPHHQEAQGMSAALLPGPDLTAAPIRRSLHTCQHQAACSPAGAGDHAAARRGVAADLAEDRGGARRVERAAALLGICVGRRPGVSAADPRPARARSPKASSRSRLGVRALRHRRDARRRALRAGGRHRCHRARCDRPQCSGE